MACFVPEDGRGEYHGRYRATDATLPAGTIVLQARVAPTRAADTAGGYTLFSKFFGLTLSHPCTVMLQAIHADKRAGAPLIMEYESRHALALKTHHGAPPAFDELYLRDVDADRAREHLLLRRAYNIDGPTIRQAPILGYMFGNDVGGGSTALYPSYQCPTDYPVHQPAGRLADAPTVASAGDAPNHLVAAAVGADGDQFDRDYLHMRQFWEKHQLDGMTAQAILCGSDATGRGTLRRHAWYVYDAARTFRFASPVVYRDALVRTHMPYCVGMLVAYSGTRDYPRHWPHRPQQPAMPYQATVVCVAREPDYATRVTALMDATLAAALSPILVPKGGPVFFPARDDTAWPQLERACAHHGLTIV